MCNGTIKATKGFHKHLKNRSTGLETGWKPVLLLIIPPFIIKVVLPKIF